MVKNQIAAAILRVVLGVVFFMHGVSKFQDGIGNTVGFFESLGLPGFAAYIVALIELIGGLAMILGIGTRIISILFALIMIGAITMVKIGEGFFGIEFDLVLMTMSICLAIVNKSYLALDNVLSRNKNQNDDYSITT
ncbi:DoxX family protein [Cytobacillus horneckiae]|uniref:DoxX family protein n=1 Tax=Cytobacillus horneckiae TaxID=549687 RepID=UPI002040DA36|nr:DoxX family protein [Cytobacillus horneckiae]MCM3177758.1 DoxX family protein [Cytobacillus horneckiae]